MKILSVESLIKLIKKHGFENYLKDLIKTLEKNFCRWQKFTNIPRPAMHVPGGVLELMPICDNKTYYVFKYVNCHPNNPLTGQQTVVATGQLSGIDTGYPLINLSLNNLFGILKVCYKTKNKYSRNPVLLWQF